MALWLGAICVSHAAPGYGVYVSNDGGASWKEASHPFKGNRVNAFVAEGERVWAGTDRGEVFVSSDKGVTWTKAGEGLPANGGAGASCGAGINPGEGKCVIGVVTPHLTFDESF